MTSEELLAECFKKLRSFITDEDFISVVITVPSKYHFPQLEAVRKAGQLAGFEQIELLQEPIATVLAYNINSNNYSVIFKFDKDGVEGTLMKGHIIIDSDGDNWLGSANLDMAIVDQIIIPYFKENFGIKSILVNTTKREILRETVKSFAKEAKTQLAYNDSHYIITNIGDLPFEDENGEELEINIEINQQDLVWISRPIYQKAVEIAVDLLKKNNLKGKNIDSICLVGEETISPILQKMLKEQITDKVDTSVDPINAIVHGATIYASNIERIKKPDSNLHFDSKFIDDLKGDLILFYADNPTMGKERFRFLLKELGRIDSTSISIDEKNQVIDSVKNEILKWK